MNEQTCQRINDLMVDFSDGELSESQCAIVEEHLLGCPLCRRELSLLEESLWQAKAIWEESASGQMPVLLGGESFARRRRRASLAAAAVSIVVLVFGAWVVREFDWSEPPVPPEPVAVIVDSSPPTDSQLAWSDINAIVANEAQAARLAASVELLSTVPSLEHYTNQAEEYLAANYANSRAGRRARQRLGQTGTFPRTDPEL